MLDVLTHQQSEVGDGFWQRHKTKLLGASLLVTALVGMTFLLTQNNSSSAKRAGHPLALSFNDHAEMANAAAAPSAAPNNVTLGAPSSPQAIQTSQIAQTTVLAQNQISAPAKATAATVAVAAPSVLKVAPAPISTNKNSSNAVTAAPMQATPQTMQIATNTNSALSQGKASRADLQNSAFASGASSAADADAVTATDTGFAPAVAAQKKVAAKATLPASKAVAADTAANAAHRQPKSKPKTKMVVNSAVAAAQPAVPTKAHAVKSATKLVTSAGQAPISAKVKTAPVLSSIDPLSAAVLSAHVARIKAVSQTHYTVQLTALSHEALAKQFVSAHSDLRSGLVYYQGKNNHLTHILYGNYATASAAHAALAQLPAGVRALHPFVRSYKDVQASLP